MTYKITLSGRTYEIQVSDGKACLLAEYDASPIAPAAPAAAAPAPAAPAAASAVTGTGEAVNAPMPGTILKVCVTQGQAVQEGTLLCVLEAMKMENEIFSPKAGTVTQVVVSKGSTVETGAPLVVIG